MHPEKTTNSTGPANPKDPISTLFALFDGMGQQAYIGERVTQLEHSLQAAHFAAQAGAPSEEILGALLHDVGHRSAPAGSPEMEDLGIVSHELIGANYLRHLGVHETVATLVEGHVQAKRYLVSKTPGYLERLSPASRRTLDFQGGPMTEQEMRHFELDPLFKAKLRVRHWDEQAKVPNLEVPGIESYRALLASKLEPTSRTEISSAHEVP